MKEPEKRKEHSVIFNVFVVLGVAVLIVFALILLFLGSLKPVADVFAESSKIVITTV